MQAPQTIKAVRLENFAQQDWLAPLQQLLYRRYPGMTCLYQRPQVVIVLLNRTSPWSVEDEAFFAALKMQAFFQRWEPLETVPPPQKANAAVLEERAAAFSCDSSRRKVAPTRP